MDVARVELLIKFCLSCAGQKDRWERELGTIHLVKYLYLADLYYAERNNGETFTGASWIFHHFGPWSVPLWDRIQPVVLETGASERKYPSPKFEKDAVRYGLEDEDLCEAVEAQLPFAISAPLRRAIQSYGDDTTALLYFVYNTPPMLAAAPGELLDFHTVVIPKEDQSAKPKVETAFQESTNSKTKQKKLDQALETRIKTFRELLTQKVQAKKVTPPTPPEFDEVFFDGLAWLDSLAGDPVEESEGEIKVDPEIWKSRARQEKEQ